MRVMVCVVVVMEVHEVCRAWCVVGSGASPNAVLMTSVSAFLSLIRSCARLQLIVFPAACELAWTILLVLAMVMRFSMPLW